MSTSHRPCMYRDERWISLHTADRVSTDGWNWRRKAGKKASYTEMLLVPTPSLSPTVSAISPDTDINQYLWTMIAESETVQQMICEKLWSRPTIVVLHSLHAVIRAFFGIDKLIASKFKGINFNTFEINCFSDTRKFHSADVPAQLISLFVPVKSFCTLIAYSLL